MIKYSEKECHAASIWTSCLLRLQQAALRSLQACDEEVYNEIIPTLPQRVSRSQSAMGRVLYVRSLDQIQSLKGDRLVIDVAVQGAVLHQPELRASIVFPRKKSVGSAEVFWRLYRHGYQSSHVNCGSVTSARVNDNAYTIQFRDVPDFRWARKRFSGATNWNPHLLQQGALKTRSEITFPDSIRQPWLHVLPKRASERTSGVIVNRTEAMSEARIAADR
ncbi:MAG: hypothetical protein R3A47_03545 [Polyangiales bacterium]